MHLRVESHGYITSSCPHQCSLQHSQEEYESFHKGSLFVEGIPHIVGWSKGNSNEWRNFYRRLMVAERHL